MNCGVHRHSIMVVKNNYTKGQGEESNKMNTLEKMSDFFSARVDGYDEHMIKDVGGCREGYPAMAALVPEQTERLLDLGCGTGLELDEIFKLLPEVEVTGIDLTEAMLRELRRKHPDKKLNLICGDYFTEYFGIEKYDCCVSFQTMHHFSHEKKTALYKKIRDALCDGGVYIECDYMVETQEEEDHWFAENLRIRKEQGIPEDAFYHYDTPCTINNQIAMLKAAGFGRVTRKLRVENTTIIVAQK